MAHSHGGGVAIGKASLIHDLNRELGRVETVKQIHGVNGWAGAGGASLALSGSPTVAARRVGHGPAWP
jgi:hypothetical protein